MDFVEPAAVPPILDPAEDQLTVAAARTRIAASLITALRELRWESRWLAVMGGAVLVEICWWAACYAVARAPVPLVLAYLVMAFAGLGCAILIRFALGLGLPERWRAALAGTILAGVGASFFLPLKYAIPTLIPFWLDPPLANIEANLVGIDPWRYLDSMLGWAAVPVDRIYALWLPIQSITLFSVMLAAPSRAKSRALIAYSLGWLVLGVGAALILSSAGPIFYDRLFSGTRFAALHDMLVERGAWMVLAESNAMWMSHASDHPGLIAGISAMPSIHVAISSWIYWVARSMAPRAAPFAFAYALFMWIGSVQLGWHYVSDGLAGIVGMMILWALAGRLADLPAEQSQTPD